MTAATRTKPMAQSTVIKKIRQANFGNVWVTEVLPDGESLQDFYAVHITVLRSDGKIRVLQSDGSVVFVWMDSIVDIGEERHKNLA